LGDDVRTQLVAALLLALVLPACATGDPSGATSVYLTVDNGPGLAAPDELLVTATSEGGDPGAGTQLFAAQRLPATGALAPPTGDGRVLGTVTVYVGAGITRLRLDVSGYAGGALQSSGAASVGVTAGKQVSASVVLEGLPGGGDAGEPADAGAPPDAGAAPDAGEPADASDGTDGGAPTDAAGDAGERPAPETTDAGCSGSLLTGTATAPPSSVDLTAEGVLDWRHWGLNDMVDFKMTAGNRISDYTGVGSGTISNANETRGLTFDWSDGSPRMSVTGAPYATMVAGTGDGFEISVPAEAAMHTLAVYVSGENDTGVLTASLSDGCVGDYTSTATDSQIFLAVHRLTFRSAAAGARLRVRWVMTAGVGAVGLHAATLY
jgi:hypothetical protein